MGKLESLKWIPLLIKAYSDVQVKRALETHAQPTVPTLSTEPSQSRIQNEDSILPLPRSEQTIKRTQIPRSPKAPLIRAPRSARNIQVRKNGMKQTQPAAKQNLSKPVQPDKIGIRAFPKTNNSNTSMRTGSYQHLIQELRETQKKLNRLEDIHKLSLKEMQTKLEQQIDKLAEHLENKNKQGITANSDPNPNTQPMMGPPFF